MVIPLYATEASSWTLRDYGLQPKSEKRENEVPLG